MISTRLPVGATRSIAWRSWLIAGDLPISSISAAGAQPQLLVLAPQPRRLDRALDHQQQPVGLERLLDEVVGAAA